MLNLQTLEKTNLTLAVIIITLVSLAFDSLTNFTLAQVFPHADSIVLGLNVTNVVYAAIKVIVKGNYTRFCLSALVPAIVTAIV
jgi:hypothetical protein